MRKNIPLICITLLCFLCAGILFWASSLAPEGSHEYEYVPTPEPSSQTSEENAQNTLENTVDSTPEPTPEPTPKPVFPAGVYKDKYEYSTEIYGTQYLEYNVVVPEGADKHMPLVVYLSSDDLNDRVDEIPESEFAKSVSDIYGNDFDFIMLLPCTRFYEWHDGWVGEVLKNLIDEVADEYSVDIDKIILTGLNRGAEGSWDMVEDYGDYFSCLVPVSGGAYVHDFEKFMDVPVWAFHGDGYSDDSLSDIVHDYVDRINEMGGTAKVDVLEGYDHKTTIEVVYTKEVIEWMLEQ